MSLLVSALLASTPAHALSCALTYVVDTRPSSGAVDVPTNVVPALRVYDGSLPGSGRWDEVTLTLQDQATGDEFEVTVEVVEGDQPSTETWLVHPTAPLPANTDFILSLENAKKLAETFTFSTGEGEDIDAPESAAADDLLYDREDDEWGTWLDLSVALVGGEDHPENWWRVAVADNPDFIDATVRASLTQPARFEDNPCSADAVAAEPSGDIWVRVTTIDLAGNAAESEIMRFDGAPEESSTGCATAGAAPGPLGALVGLMGLLCIRRRRS